jgi:hypothetical protein
VARTLKSLNVVKIVRIASFDDCMLLPITEVMDPTPTNTLYLNRADMQPLLFKGR